MRRREFFGLLGGAAAAWPLTARAQQPAMPVVGFLNHGSPDAGAHLVAAFLKGLREGGYVEGQNVRVEYRWGNNDGELVTQLAADLVRRRVSLIATPISTPAALAAKAATTAIPIVFGIGGDPVQIGLVSSFNRPGGNVTGVSVLNWELQAKRLGLLNELLPAAAGFAALVNPKTPGIAEPFVKEVQAAASALGRWIEILSATNNGEIDTAFQTLIAKKASGLLVSPDLLFNNRRTQLVALTSRHAIPAIYPWREAVEGGGLMSYGPSFAEGYRQVGLYAARVLNGEKPGDLPVMQSSKFEFVINIQTAKTIGLAIPPSLLARADDVIE